METLKLKHGTEVFYNPMLSGGGEFTLSFVLEIVKDYKFNNALEFCAGPSFIGLALLDSGICNKLLSIDKNKHNSRALLKTKTKNRLKNFKFEISNNFNDHIENTDLFICNPPMIPSREELDQYFRTNNFLDKIKKVTKAKDKLIYDNYNFDKIWVDNNYYLNKYILNSIDKFKENTHFIIYVMNDFNLQIFNKIKSISITPIFDKFSILFFKNQ